ncbi:tRNA (adenosine(37)-N6)-threonylcarbamoyltransferase complex transferase subunit TsaD [Candidatus Acetothermia bacterium]|nr:tRNA (adenosine(37)-N6)-threonylcarbamoyltransferase complex transferase subunit TsaD [Candidatus Acetothermia bacterium]MBI3644037.1 tRNA (adenosine(37)-N6)-threonylcarbamoyltransferase complex transferase subunit TsaD [Candidatus Acetothermia bacterium]
MKEKNFYTLGIETSCDETAAAILRGDRELLSNIVYSQAEIHKKYGGVVPEVASRDHLRKIQFVINEALTEAGVHLPELDLIGVTQGPGLVGCLLVGLSTAKGISFGLEKPLIGVNHLEGHLFAHYIESGLEAPPPFVALIVSGGHTSLVHVREWGHYEVIGETRDDAAGEAFDKVGKLIGLGYPAGIEVDRLSKQGNRSAIAFPRPMLDEPGFDFSFAGLKTAILYHMREHPETSQADLAASFQEAVVDVLVEKTLRAADDLKIGRIVVVGGVAANSRLRERFQSSDSGVGVDVHFPSLNLCTDNAAMIAAVAHFHYASNPAHVLNGLQDLSPSSSLRL